MPADGHSLCGAGMVRSWDSPAGTGRGGAKPIYGIDTLCSPAKGSDTLDLIAARRGTGGRLRAMHFNFIDNFLFHKSL